MDKRQSRSELIGQLVAGKRVLDLGVAQHSTVNVMKPTWLHQYVVSKASECLGVDNEQDAVDAIRKLGYDAVCGDVQRLALGKTFDVVVAGELIEHLDNFAGFLSSVHKHLEDDGRFVLTTPNALFIGHSISAISGKLAIHKQHTCWFDEVTLRQLLIRFKFEVEAIAYLGSRRWLLLPIPKRTSASTLVVIARKAKASQDA